MAKTEKLLVNFVNHVHDLQMCYKHGIVEPVRWCSKCYGEACPQCPKKLSRSEMVLRARQNWYAARVTVKTEQQELARAQTALDDAKDRESKALDIYLGQLELMAAEIK